MKIVGFTFVRNAIKYDYPIVESILSILPLVDEFIVLVGNSDDETESMIKNIDSDKIKIHHSTWNDELREGGRVLAIETDKALALINDDADWAFYLQADEIVHEKYHQKILATLKLWQNNEQVEGILFKYKHFYGSYDYVGNSRSWYKHEVRIIRPNQKIYSFRDAQGFQKNGKRLKVKEVDAYIYHYGWVKSPEKQQQKQLSFNKFWHSDNWVKQNIKDGSSYDYSSVDCLTLFNDSHPKVMYDRIKDQNWEFQYDTNIVNLGFKDNLLRYVEKYLGISIGVYKNYRIIK